MSLLVRNAADTDLDRVWTLLRQFAVSYPPDREAFEKTLPSVVGRQDAIFLVVERDGNVAGYLIGFVLPTLFANGPILEIVELVIDEAMRSNGLGKILVRTALEKATENGCVEAVVPTRRAGRFYESLGFVKSAEYFKIPI